MEELGAAPDNVAYVQNLHQFKLLRLEWWQDSRWWQEALDRNHFEYYLSSEYCSSRPGDGDPTHALGIHTTVKLFVRQMNPCSSDH